jgi:hypothetical protein
VELYQLEVPCLLQLRRFLQLAVVLVPLLLVPGPSANGAPAAPGPPAAAARLRTSRSDSDSLLRSSHLPRNRAVC